jgi:hypothetical protein
MSVILEQFEKAKGMFLANRQKEEGNLAMNKITELVNELGANFNTLDGGELAEIQIKLAGYKFYLSDYISDLNQTSEALKLHLKEIRAMRWDEVTAQIKAVEGKVKNKEQIENIIVVETMDIAHDQILYENLYYKMKLKLSAINDILTAIVQKIAEKKREIEQAKAT